MPWNFVEVFWDFVEVFALFVGSGLPRRPLLLPLHPPQLLHALHPPHVRLYQIWSQLILNRSQLVSIRLNWSQSQSWCRERLVLSDSPLNSTIIQVCVDTTFQLLHFKKYLEIFRLLEYPILPPPARPIRHKCHNKTGTKRGIIDPLVSKQPEFVVWNNFLTQNKIKTPNPDFSEKKI